MSEMDNVGICQVSRMSFAELGLTSASEKYLGRDQVLLGMCRRNGTRFPQSPKRHGQGLLSSICSSCWQAKVAKNNEAEGSKYELRVCTHRTCRKSGALQTLELLKGLASPNVSVESCGCLGRCGMGPNLVVLPTGIFVGHCNTAAHAARLLALQCGLSDPENNLKALSLKQQGIKSFESGDFTEAETMFSEAIDLQPSGGLHLLYANRSAARLSKGDAHGALEDANCASVLAPRWHVPHLRQGEAYMVIGDCQSAQSAYTKALSLDPSLRRSKSYQSKIRELERALTLVNTFA
ncbi:hypothetical protein GOP47_0001566 [Adiantum capillus-veneris]|uniref:Uncharacterized protein n=1 Tax=Adiantum capillus-veneris TaxID=13818 RepID=A0A9D4V8Y1_ADICA|nr:hypothetical protein GOP47_0001566 [Adiantum capillus-veneris]